MSALRSGSTLLRYVLDAHPRIACPPETKMAGALDAFLRHPQTLAGLGSLGFGREDIVRRPGALMQGILDDYTRRAGKSRWVEKTPNNYMHLELIDELFEGRARYIVLVRHPLDCVESIEEFFSADVKTDPDIARMAEAFGAGRMTWARYWREVYNRIELFTRRPEDRVYLLTYEQLVSAPLPAAQAVFDFLDEQCPESIIEDAFSQPHTGGFQDPKIRSTSGVHGASVGRWRERPLSEARELWQYVSDIADGYGYSGPD